MWISRYKYERLIERIEQLEKAVERPEEVMYGRFNPLFTDSLPQKEWIDNPSYNHSGEKITVKALVCKIANHLGLVRTEATPGYWEFPETKVKK